MKRLLAYLFIPFLLFVSCDSWLDVVPEEDIATIDSEFETYDEAYQWLKSAYVYMQDLYGWSDNVAMSASDELVSDTYLRNTVVDWQRPTGLEIIAGRQSVLDPCDDTWFNVFSGGGRRELPERFLHADSALQSFYYPYR